MESQQSYEGVPEELRRHGFPKKSVPAYNTMFFSTLSSKATENGFELLETQWLGALTKHRFRHVDSGKIYAGTPNHLMGKAGFPKDLRTPLDKLKVLCEHAQKNGFKLLETQWLGSKTKHRFKHLDSGMVYAWVAQQVLSKKGFPKNLNNPVIHKTSNLRFDDAPNNLGSP